MVFYPCRSSSSNNQPSLAHTLNDLEQQNDNFTSPYTKKEIKQFKTVQRSKTHVDNVLYNNRHSGRKSLLSSDGVVLFSGFVDWITLKRLRENKERGTKYEMYTEDVQFSVTPAFEQVSRIDPVKSGFMAKKSDRDGAMKCAAGTLVKDEWAEQERRMSPSRTKTAATADKEEDKGGISLFCTPQKKENGGGSLLFGSSDSGVGIMDMCSISPAAITNTAGVNDSFGTVSTMASSCHGSPPRSDIKKSNNTDQEENNKDEESIWCDLFASVLEEETADKSRQHLLLQEEEEEERKKKLNTPEKKIRGIQNVEVVYGDDDKKKKGGRRKSLLKSRFSSSRSSPKKKKKSSTTPSLTFREKYL